MEIWHRANLKPDMEPLLRDWKIKYEYVHSSVERTRITHLLVTVAESDPGWQYIAPLVKNSEVTVWTDFTRTEIENAEWLVVRPDYSIGYPPPEETIWSDLYTESSCTKCRVGWRQIAPYHIKKDLSLKRKSFASFWGGFELFCTPEVVAAFETEQVQGYVTRPVLIHKTGEPSQHLRQIIVPQMAHAALVEEIIETERFAKHLCPSCGQAWYDYYLRGMLPLRRTALLPDIDFQRTVEWFGNGRTARQEILISQRVAQLVVHNNWQGLMLSPVQLV
jgi:hypothetical protein